MSATPHPSPLAAQILDALPFDPPDDPADPRAVVIAVFPLATAAWAIGRWTVAAPGPAGVLGAGASEAGAWEDAAEAIEQARATGWGWHRRGRGRAGR